MSWVEERAQRDEVLWKGAPGVWDGVRSALQDACESYNTRYCNPDFPEVDCKLENGKRILISRNICVTDAGGTRQTRGIVIVEFIERDPGIRFTRTNPDESGKLRFSSTDKDVLVIDASGNPLT